MDRTLSKEKLMELIQAGDIQKIFRNNVRLGRIWDTMSSCTDFGVGHTYFLKTLINYTKIQKYESYCVTTFFRLMLDNNNDLAELMAQEFSDVWYYEQTFKIIMIQGNNLYIVKKFIDQRDKNNIVENIKNIDILDYFGINDYDNLIKNALTQGNTELLKIIHKRNIIPNVHALKVSLEHSNAECVKYFCNHYKFSIKIKDSINYEILLDDECESLLGLKERVAYENINRTDKKFKLEVYKKYITKETKSNFPRNMLILNAISKGQIKVVKYICQIYDDDDVDDLYYRIWPSSRGKCIIKLFKLGLLNWKPEYSAIILKIIAIKDAIELLSYLRPFITHDDLDSFSVAKHLVQYNKCELFDYIKKEYDINYCKYVPRLLAEDVLGCTTIDIIERFWCEDMANSARFMIHKKHYILLRSMIIKKCIYVPDELYKKNVGPEYLVDFGFVCNSEIGYEYVYKINCKYPELLEDPVLRKICMFRNGIFKRMKEYPSDVLILF